MWCRLLPAAGMLSPQLFNHFYIIHAFCTLAFFISCCLLCTCFFFTIPVCPLVKKGAKEFVDQNMLRSQKSRKRRRLQRATNSSCPGPSGSAEEGKEGESGHETTSSSGRTLISLDQLLLKPLGALFRQM